MSLFCNFIKTVKKQCFFINDKLSARSRTGLNTLDTVIRKNLFGFMQRLFISENSSVSAIAQS